MARKTAVFLLLAVLLAAAVGLSGCAREEAAQSEKMVTVKFSEVVRSIFYAPQYVAINKGFFEDEGLKLDLTTAQGADKVMTALLSGEADIGLAGPEATVYVYNEGQKDYAINFAQLTRTDGSFLVGRQKEPDFKWENLKGKTIIGGRPGGIPEMVLEYVLKQHGLTPGKDVNIITNLQFTATAGAFKGGTGDYVALFEPTASMLEKEGAGYVVASIGLSSGELPYTVYMARKSYIEEHPEVVQKFTNAIYRGQLWVASHEPHEVAEAIASFFPGTDMDILTKVVERYKEQDTWNANPYMEYAPFVYFQNIIKSAGELDKTVEPSVLITHKFAGEAMETQPEK
jgi:NitT/TauT family transport system substrate-binding protein